MKGSLVDWLLSLTPMQSPLYAMYSWLIHTTVYLTITALFIILFKFAYQVYCAGFSFKPCFDFQYRESR